jgi:anti-sigma factor RsiW
MSSHHLSEDRCLDYLTGELSTDEQAFFAEHLEACLVCRERVKEYEELLRVELPSIANEVAIDTASSPLPWSVEGEKRLRAALN